MKNNHDNMARRQMLEKKQSEKNNPTWDMAYCCSVDFEPTMILPFDPDPPRPTLQIMALDPEATIPTKANDSDAGYDLYALQKVEITPQSHRLIKTGIAMAIPQGYAGFIWPRSGLAYKHGLDVLAGVIDSGYRGDVGVILHNPMFKSYTVEPGERIAQIVFQMVYSFDLKLSDNLDQTQRGHNGFGSSGD